MLDLDPFESWYDWYPDFDKLKNPIPRPQPIDTIIQTFNGMKNGVFVDVGAYDGVTWSNSLALEKYLDWKGICIEPIPEVFESLTKTRSVKCVQSAITDYDGEVEFVHVEGYAEMLSGITQTMNTSHIERIESEIRNHGGRKEVLKLRAEKLQTVLDREEIDRIDYMSIDVECGELAVLKGINWDKTSIKLVSCEINQYTDGSAIFEFLKNLGYNHLGRVCGDEFFLKV